jgi:hypothetical protein
MEPITLIVTALFTGAAAGVADTAGDAVKDAYQALKAAILRRFGRKPEVTVPLEQAEQRPEAWRAALQDALAAVGADREPDIVRAAQQLMALAEPAAARAGKFNVQISGNVQGVAVGDHQHVEMRFDAGPQR